MARPQHYQAPQTFKAGWPSPRVAGRDPYALRALVLHRHFRRRRRRALEAHRRGVRLAGRTTVAKQTMADDKTVAKVRIELADHFGRDVGSDRIVVEHKIGQSDIAAMAGIARENVNRVLKDWERRKIVSRRSGYYCLEKKSKLEREIQQL